MLIENERYAVSFCEKGGEITSFLDKQTGIEYMWQGDAQYWSGKNPTLFPLVGNTYSSTYEIDGKTYAMKNHGLIRYATLHCSSQEKDSLTMTFDSNEETLAQYPFAFHYEISYTLVENRLTIQYHITNCGEQMMPFSFGLHPGFRCPLSEGEAFEDYQISFDQKETLQQLVFDIDKKNPYVLKDVELQSIPCDYALYEKYATLIYQGAKSAYVTLRGKEHGVKLSIAGYPYVAFWTAKRGAPFVCLEPWYGHGDFSDTKEDFYHREGTMTLSPNKTFTTAYSIEVF